MASVSALLNQLFLFFLLWLHTLSSSSQAVHHQYSSEFRYPFIKKASSFSPGGHGDSAYDYIIVGGGTAGCPLAATLSQKFNVLLLERGGMPFGNANVSLLKNFHITLADTSSTSASQYFISTDGVLNSRARVLGGGTCINAGFYTRASTRFINKVGWDSELVNKSYPWIEKQIVYRPKVAPWQAVVRDSLLGVGVAPFNGFTYDHIYGTKFGGTIFDRLGRRHTAAELLAPADPQKLTVLVHATVQKVLFDTSGKRPKAAGVLFKDENGNQHQAFLSSSLKSEVILSCGAIGTPQMLLLSGVGPKAELEEMKISSVLDNKFVGQGMADNPMNAVFVPSKETSKAVAHTNCRDYQDGGFGESDDSIECHHGIISAEIGQLSTIPPEQRTPEAIQAYIRRKKDIPYEAFRGGFILEKIAHPISTGQLKLISTNAEDNPSVTFNYFKHPHDLQSCVDGIRMVIKMVQSEHFTNFTQFDKQTTDKILNMSASANVNLIPKHANDTKSLEQFCKDTVLTIWHYHGGCHVGKVVDREHKVLGAHRLRIVDGSVFDESPGTNPQATIMMMGRYMGLKILRDRLGKAAGV
uniref:Glucose-methanol-choline oxidoreductase N-terminal domain-containing protein n=1 Tax=Salix viminalis TaxID=40686 RepID=A0A6N2NHL6_SALVM